MPRIHVLDAKVRRLREAPADVAEEGMRICIEITERATVGARAMSIGSCHARLGHCVETGYPPVVHRAGVDVTTAQVRD